MATAANVLQFSSAFDTNTGSSDERDSGSPFRSSERETSAPSILQSETVSFGPRASEVATLQYLGNGQALVHPLYLRLEQHPDVWYAISLDLGLIAEGESDVAAIEELRSAVADLFESLIELRDSLGPEPLGQLAFLERLTGAS